MLNQKSFNFIMATAVLLVLAIPVGIANFYLGYIVGEGPCTLCWQERIGMVVTGVAGILILRYGLKIRYVAMVFISGGYGIFMTLRHTSFMSSRDMGMGFGGDIFGAHTYTWGVLVYWVVVIFMGVLLLLVKDKSITDEFGQKETKVKALNPYAKTVVWLSFVVILSNAIQAFISAGPPPYVGKGSPERISLNNTWIFNVWPRLTKPFSFTGANVVEKPFLAGVLEPKFTKFNPNPNDGAFADLKPALKIEKEITLPFEVKGIFGKGNASGIAYNPKDNSFAITNTDGGVYFTDDNFKLTHNAILDMPNGRNLSKIADSTFVDNKLISTGINKTLFSIEKAPKEKIDAYKEWVTLRDTSGGLLVSWKQDRPYILTVRAKKQYVLTLAKDPDTNFMYMVSVPNERIKREVLIKIDTTDSLLSGESVIKTSLPLKENRNINDYYITASAIKDGKLWAYSKNYNTLLAIDLEDAKVVDAYAMPSIGDVESMAIKNDSFYILTRKDNKDLVVELSMPI